MEFLKFPVSARGLRAVRLPRLPLLTAGTATRRAHDRIGTVLLLGQYPHRVAWTRALHDKKHPVRTECSAFEPASERPEHRGDALRIWPSPGRHPPEPELGFPDDSVWESRRAAQFAHGRWGWPARHLGASRIADLTSVMPKLSPTTLRYAAVPSFITRGLATS